MTFICKQRLYFTNWNKLIQCIYKCSVLTMYLGVSCDRASLPPSTQHDDRYLGRNTSLFQVLWPLFRLRKTCSLKCRWGLRAHTCQKFNVDFLVISKCVPATTFIRLKGSVYRFQKLQQQKCNLFEYVKSEAIILWKSNYFLSIMAQIE